MKLIIDIDEETYTKAQVGILGILGEIVANGVPYEEKPQGEWYYSIDKGWECNQCHEIVKDMPTCMRKALYNFCPNCGAELRKGGAE